jgi:hypothetical protein
MTHHERADIKRQAERNSTKQDEMTISEFLDKESSDQSGSDFSGDESDADSSDNERVEMSDLLKNGYATFNKSGNPGINIWQVNSDPDDDWQNQPQPVFDRRETPEARQRRLNWERELELQTKLDALPIHKAAEVIVVENSQQAENSVSSVTGTNFITEIVQEYKPENGVDKREPPSLSYKWLEFDPAVHGYNPKYFPEGRYVALEFSFLKCEQQDCTCSLHESFKYQECAVYVPEDCKLPPTIQFFKNKIVQETTV